MSFDAAWPDSVPAAKCPANVTPAADIYSVRSLTLYMLTAGKRFARENVFDLRCADYFAKGPRHEFLISAAVQRRRGT